MSSPFPGSRRGPRKKKKWEPGAWEKTMRDRHIIPSRDITVDTAVDLYHGCHTKQRFPSKSIVVGHIKAKKRNARSAEEFWDLEKLNVYKCRMCKAWHYGHDNRRVG